jgi:hypothetical protein
MKSTMSGWSTLRMTILAARRVLPPDLMTPAKASKPRMKLSGPEAVPPPERVPWSRGWREVGACARAPLEEHALGLGEGEDGVERVLHGVDEAGEHCGLRVAGDGEGDLAQVCGVPVPVLGVGVGLEAVAADVEPDGRVEGDLLVEEQVGELGVEDVGVSWEAK